MTLGAVTFLSATRAPLELQLPVQSPALASPPRSASSPAKERAAIVLLAMLGGTFLVLGLYGVLGAR